MRIHAFPSGHNPKTGMYENGMTLEDYFAAKAMQALIINNDKEFTGEIAYQYARHMIKARNEQS